MSQSGGLGRVAVIDRAEGARRVLRALRELEHTGEAAGTIALHGPDDRSARYVREADAACEMDGPPATLPSIRADTIWLGPAPLSERAALAARCALLGVRMVGPPAEVLARLAAPGAAERLARELGVPSAPPRVAPGSRRLEVAVARDQGGITRVLGVADASLCTGGAVVLAESPAPALAPDEDAAARDLALRACGSSGWLGVCAVQLLFDPASRTLAFLGCDAIARTAPALEAASGVDLVRLALLLAAGVSAGGIAPVTRGHAFAARLLACDPEAHRPGAPGRLELLKLPFGPGLRSETAIEVGDDAPARADAALVTLVAHGEDRPEALLRLLQALADTDIVVRGAPTAKAWLLALCGRPEVRQGEAGVGFLEDLAARGERLVHPRADAALLAASVEAYDLDLDLERARFLAEARRGRPRVGPSSGRAVELRYQGHRRRLDVRQVAPDQYRVAEAGAAPVNVRVERVDALERRLAWNGRRCRVLSLVDGPRLLIDVDGVPHVILRDPAGVVASPMPAIVVAIPVSPGQRVSAGDPVARIESMKVELAVPAPTAGVVREVVAIANAQVEAGAPLVRLDPLGDEEPRGAALEPIAPEGWRLVEPLPPRERWLDGLEELYRLSLGFDMAPAEARRLLAAWRDLGAGAPAGDAQAFEAEGRALRAFADLQSLFMRRRAPDRRAARPPLEELWRYLHEPEARGAGLSPGFVVMLRRALAHYGVSLDGPGRELELALLRIQKAHERAGDRLAPMLAILERRLSGEGPPPGIFGGEERDLLERLTDLGRERFPALADLARELRYRWFDQPALERARADAYRQADEDLALLAAAPGEAEPEPIVRRLVACTQPLATLLVSRMAAAPPSLRPRLVEILLRRYYRERPLSRVSRAEVEGAPCALADHDREEQRLRVVACFALAGDAARAALALARLASDVPADRELVAELYLWQEGAPCTVEEMADRLRVALAQAGFPGPVRRASVVVAISGRGLQNQASQQHFTFSSDGSCFAEEPRYRGVHPMLFERTQLGRLSRFDLEPLPSAEDVYLYRAVAQGNPKDERLFAVAEVRDLTPVQDTSGRVVRLPQLERMLQECAAGMRRFQAGRAPHQRLEWNRVLLSVGPPLLLTREEIHAVVQRLAPVTDGLGLEMLIIDARVPDASTGELRDVLLRIVPGGQGLSVRYDVPTDRPLEPMAEYQQRVIQLRRRGLTHPYEIVRMLAPPGEAESGVPPGEFVEYDLDAAGALVPVDRAPGGNSANVVVGVVTTFTDRYPEGMRRVAVLGDPSRAMGSVAEPECRRIEAALALAERLGVPLEWFAVSAGAKISMESGTENMDWIGRVLRRLIEFTQGGGEVNVVVTGINVGAQPYWNAEATMLMHTRGVLIMTPGSSMVLTGKEALEYSGSVSAEDNEGIGGYDRIMGPNGEAQYQAASLGEAIQILLRHYDHSYVAPGERLARRAVTSDPRERDVRSYPHGPAGGAGFVTVGDVFSAEHNPDRKKPFDIRRVMSAVIDQDHPPLERWRDARGGDTAVAWDAHLGGWPVCLIGIESRSLPRLEFVPADGPEHWSAGTLFPQSSKKVARTVNAASGSRPVVVLANLSGFDGSPESMRRLQLEYGAEIGRAVVNFRGPIVFCVVSRYHGGAFVVFSKALREDMEVVAVEGARASVIGGAPAAAVVFAREVEARTRDDARVREAERAAGTGGPARARLSEVLALVRSEKVGIVAEEFDRIHTVERALRVGSLDRIISPSQLRPYLIDAVERGIARFVDLQAPATAPRPAG
jgi:acetyl/propionyl-CoA carboxylase alpha subunit/acetyl-CoA carboxylase carboxyltransferase component